MTTEFKAADTTVEDWIDGISYLQADVTIYRNPALLAEYRPLIARIDVLEEELVDLQAPPEPTEDAEKPLSGDDAPLPGPSAAEERSMREKPVVDPRVAEVETELEELYARAEELHAQFINNREVWTVRKFEEEESAALNEQLGGLPKPPPDLPRNASKTMRAKHAEKFDQFIKDMAEYTKEFNLHAVPMCTLAVVVNGKPVAKLPDVDDMRRILARPGGLTHISELVSAIEKLQAEGVAITAPHRDRA